MPLVRLLVQRTMFSLVVLLVVSAILFVLTHLVPGSPALIVLGPEAGAQQIEQFDHDYGLDRPLVVQYLNWLANVLLHGDFGRSYVTGLPVMAELGRTLPITLEIVIVAFVFCVAVSILLGIVSALYEDRLIDHVGRVFAVVGVSIPGFWLGLMLIVYGAVQVQLFPPGGFVPLSAGIWPHVRSMVLPAFALGIYYTAIISRMTRSSMVEVLSQDYMRTARSMGLGRARILVYAVKNALVPVVSVSAMSFGYMFGSAIIIEQVFNIAGFARALLTAIFQRDYYTLQALVFVITAVFVVANLVADALYAVLNPRIRSGRL